jgi:peptide deformylase
MTALHIMTVNATVRDLADVAVRCAARDLRADEIDAPWCRELIADLFETLYGTPGGIGLAAPQVGVLLRLAVIDLRDGSTPRVLINPAYRPAGDERETEDERCLSVPDFTGPVDRFRQVTVDHLDQRGLPCNEVVADFPARVIQHEIDHLDGILCIDRVTDRALLRPETGGYPARQARRTAEALFADG